jgi:hypothetical protein
MCEEEYQINFLKYDTFLYPPLFPLLAFDQAQAPGGRLLSFFLETLVCRKSS